MRKQNTEINLNGITFTDLSKREHASSLPYEARDIFYAYRAPSSAKRAIWGDWDKWSRELPDSNPSIACCDLWITSKNAQFFSIGGRILFNDGTTALIRITSTKHEFWYV